MVAFVVLVVEKAALGLSAQAGPLGIWKTLVCNSLSSFTFDLVALGIWDAGCGRFGFIMINGTGESDPCESKNLHLSCLMSNKAHFIKKKVNLHLRLITASDDSVAIMMAFQAPGVEVLGLTTIFGNCTTAYATRNALILASTTSSISDALSLLLHLWSLLKTFLAV